MKRILSAALTLVLLLGLLPTTAFAGGGAAALIWGEDFSAADSLSGWTVLDCNNDGYGFGWDDTGRVRSDVPLGYETLPMPSSCDDYLISPPIVLREDEDVLRFTIEGNDQGGDVMVDTYVFTGGETLTTGNISFLLGEPARIDVWIPYSGCHKLDKTLDLTAYAGQTVRLVVHAYGAGSLLLLDDFNGYWNEPDELLDKVTAMNVPEPTVGKQVSDCKESDIVFPENANYALIPGSLTYYRTEDEQMREFTGTFAGGEEYSLTFEVMAKPGSEVNDPGIASVNGRSAVFRSLSGETVDVTMYFRRLQSPLESVAVTVTPPLAGRDPSEGSASAASSHFTVLERAYFPVNSDGTSGDVLEGAPFELGQTYRIMVLLAPENGWTFTDETCVTINGKTATYFGEFNYLPIYQVDMKADRVLFTDVKPDQWYTGAVEFCYMEGLMAGTGDGFTFSLNMPFSRAMFVTVLSKIDGADTAGYTDSHFSDVKPGKWYSCPVEWAYQKEYAGGTGGGKFSPDAAVTRETLAVFLYNYSQKKFGSLGDVELAELSAYPDAKDVSDWAEEAMRWAVGEGLIGGKTVDGQLCLSPRSTATRAEVALIVMNYVYYIQQFYLD